jgi:alpha-tubulin suppressor-like RCC1 family protein
LGNGGRDDSLTPVKVEGLTGVAQIAVSLSTVCARLESGKVSCWGSNYKGEVGNGSEESARTPVEVPRLSRVTDLSGGGYNFCVVAGGNVSCWGGNDRGQVGNGQVDGENPARSPSQVRGPRNAVRVFVGTSGACALQRDGKMLCWGFNSFRQLGVGAETEDNVTRPTVVDLAADETVKGFGNYVSLSCGRVHCCGLHVDGHVSCAGRTPINGGSDFFGLQSVSSPFPVPAPGIQFPAVP